jgi:hypothetical protein
MLTIVEPALLGLLEEVVEELLEADDVLAASTPVVVVVVRGTPCITPVSNKFRKRSEGCVQLEHRLVGQWPRLVQGHWSHNSVGSTP